MSLTRILPLLLAAMMAGTAAAQTNHADLVIQESKLTVKETIDALAKALESQGVKIAARVDHAAGARSVNQELAPMEVLMFGNPQIGTPLMRANPLIGIELPMKVLAWQDKSGKVLVAYTRPDTLKARYAVKDADPQFAAMAGALAKFSAAALGGR